MYLDVSGTGLCDNGITVLCKGLKWNKSLIQLGLGNNDITVVGMEALKDTLVDTNV